MAEPTAVPEPHRPNADHDVGPGSGWWLVLLPSGVCVAGAVVAVVATLLF